MKRKLQEKLIKIIISSDYVYDNYTCNCGCCDLIINNFNSVINNNYDDELLGYLNSLDMRIFTDKYFFTGDYYNNSNRDKIRNFKGKKEIVFDYDLLKEFISKDYNLIKYSGNLDDSLYIELGIINPLILYESDSKVFLIKEILKGNYLTSLVLDCSFYDNDDSYIYINQKTILSDNSIYELYIDGLKKYLENNILEFYKLSIIARSDLDLCKYVLSINNKLICYMSDNIREKLIVN